MSGLRSIGLGSLRPLLLLQFLLLAGCLAVAVTAGPSVDPNAARTILAGMLGVSAMAVQNALGHVSLTGPRWVGGSVALPAGLALLALAMAPGAGAIYGVSLGAGLTQYSATPATGSVAVGRKH